MNDRTRPLLDVEARGLTFARFAVVNRDRCESPDGFGHPVDGWSLSDWMLAATGEFGEAANVAKKLNRVRDGIPGNTRTPEELHADLADEFADAVIYLDLAAQSQGIDLGAAIASKFDRTSEKIGAPHRLSAAAYQPTGPDDLAGLRDQIEHTVLDLTLSIDQTIDALVAIAARGVTLTGDAALDSLRAALTGDTGPKECPCQHGQDPECRCADPRHHPAGDTGPKVEPEP